jgi:hypothetical protein
MATIPQSGGVIHGCFRTAGGNSQGNNQGENQSNGGGTAGQLRIVDNPASCKANETAISWNKEGPRGATGPTGLAGATGAVGSKGDQGVKGELGPTGPAGARGAAGNDGAACLPSIPACVGPQGLAGVQGPTGAQGPVGPGGGSLGSLDALAGIPCNAAGFPGTVEIAYGPPPAGAVTLACKPTATPTLTVTKTGAGSGTVTSNVGRIACGSTCSDAFATGVVVTLTATASADDVFTGWSGACTGAAATCTVTMNTAQTVTATFAVGVGLAITQSGGSLWTTPSGLGYNVWGTDSMITSVPAGISCRHYVRYVGNYYFGIPVVEYDDGTCSQRFPIGASVTLSQRYNHGSGPVVWGGACAGATGTTCTVELTANKSVTVAY